MSITTFTSKVLDKKHLTHDVIVLSFKRPEDFHFKEGQYLMLSITRDDKTKLKAYSILTPPSHKDSLDLCIKLVPGGFASEYFKTTKPGDEFIVKGPFGHFVFDECNKDRDQWLLGAGTGVAPLYCMVQENIKKFPNTKFTVVFGVRKKENLFLHQEFLDLEKKHDNFTYIPTLTREEWKGKQGRVQEHLPKDLQNKIFYICGLKDLVIETKEALLKQNVPVQRIKFERYS